jgi:hypothetical protein
MRICVNESRLQQILHNVTANIRKAEASALMLVSQLGVIHPEAPQNGRMEIVNIHRILHNVIAVVIRLAVGLAAFNPTARHPNRKASRMMIAAIVRFR